MNSVEQKREGVVRRKFEEQVMRLVERGNPYETGRQPDSFLVNYYRELAKGGG